MEKDSKFYGLLQDELDKVIKKIKNDKEELLCLKKPIEKMDASYSNRIMSCIMYISNKYRNYTDDELNFYYYEYDNAKFEFDRIMDIVYFINCINGIDYILTKKAVCMMLGISIEKYQSFLKDTISPSQIVFKNIEEYLISIRQEGAEVFTRNALAIDTNLRTQGEFGGYNVKTESPKLQTNTKGFNVIDATVEEVRKRLSMIDFGEEKSEKHKNNLQK